MKTIGIDYTEQGNHVALDRTRWSAYTAALWAQIHDNDR